MPQQQSDSFKNVQVTLEEFKQKLIILLSTDLSKIHISHEWSFMPYVNDHLEFLIEQTSGLLESLNDSPPPKTLEEIKTLNDVHNQTEDNS